MSDKAKMDALVGATRRAIQLTEEAERAIASRNDALDHLVELIHGDRTGAIRNAQQRIGWLMTKGGV